MTAPPSLDVEQVLGEVLQVRFTLGAERKVGGLRDRCLYDTLAVFACCQRPRPSVRSIWPCCRKSQLAPPRRRLSGQKAAAGCPTLATRRSRLSDTGRSRLPDTVRHGAAEGVADGCVPGGALFFGGIPAWLEQSGCIAPVQAVVGTRGKVLPFLCCLSHAARPHRADYGDPRARQQRGLKRLSSQDNNAASSGCHRWLEAPVAPVGTRGNRSRCRKTVPLSP